MEDLNNNIIRDYDAFNTENNMVLNHMNIGISIHLPDEAFTMLWGNSFFYQMLGYTEETFLSAYSDLRNYFAQSAEEFDYMHTSFEKACFHDASCMECTLKIPVKDQKSRWFNITGMITNAKNHGKRLLCLVYTDVNRTIMERNDMKRLQQETMDNMEWVISQYPGNVYISDMDTYDLLYVNKTSCETLNQRKDELIGRKCYEAIQGRSEPCPFCTNDKLRKDKAYEWEFYNPMLKRTFQIKNRMLEWKGHRSRIELSYDMFSEEYKLAKKDQEREAILNTIPGGMTRFDARDLSTVLWHNENFLSIIGYTEEQFRDELHNQCTYIHPEDFDRVLEIAEKLKDVGGSTVFETRMIRRDGEERLLTVTLCYVNEQDSWDGIPSFYSIGLDTTEEKLKLKKLQHRAEKDALTGVFNRAETEMQIKQYLHEHPNEKAALIMIDTDNFKQINDSYGHMVGDVVLTAMASCMNKYMRENDIVGRIGGDEFTILMKNISSTQNAEDKIEGLLYSIRHLFEKEKNSIDLTCSIGIAICPDHGTTFENLYAAADKALYQAKMQGKNTYVVYNEQTLLETNNVGYSTLGARIDSEERNNDEADNLARHIFRILYGMEDFDKAINIVLGIIGKQFDVSRTYIFESSEDGEYGSNTYEWCNDGVPSQMQQLQNMFYKDLDNYDQLFDEDLIFYCLNIDDLKPKQRELFLAQGIHSTLQCAFRNDNVFGGFIGFDECSGTRLWTQEEVTILSLISQIILTFLRQKKAVKLKKKNRQYEDLLDAMDTCIYVSDTSGTLLYGNQKYWERCNMQKNTSLKHSKISAQDTTSSIIWDGQEALLHIESTDEASS